MAQIIRLDDLMSLSRIELNEHVPPIGEVDLALAVVDGVDALAPQAAEGGVTFRLVNGASKIAVIAWSFCAKSASVEERKWRCDCAGPPVRGSALI